MSWARVQKPWCQHMGGNSRKERRGPGGAWPSSSAGLEGRPHAAGPLIRSGEPRKAADGCVRCRRVSVEVSVQNHTS